MNTTLKILLLEEDSNNASLINDELEKANMKYALNVLESNENFLNEIQNFNPDLIISDFSSINFSSMTERKNSFQVMKENNHKVPFILIATDVTLEFAIECNKAGADNYILKDNLDKLPFIIETLFDRKDEHADRSLVEMIHNKLVNAYIEMEERNKEIMDNIIYARHIQEAMLPNIEILRRQFPESFILYRPKDIVSGDFYWFEEYQSSFVIVAADCTGHGVSGALISMMGHCLLNTIVAVRGITRPADIIRRLNNGIRHFLKQDMNQNYSGDGMDIAVCTIDRKNDSLQFAGANRSLYYIANNDLELIRGNKFGIGGRPDDSIMEYTNHEMSYVPNGIIYLSTDGFADQLGGDLDKRLSTKRLLNWLGSLYRMDADSQLNILNEWFDAWKGENEQTDDVLMIGLRLTNDETRDVNYDEEFSFVSAGRISVKLKNNPASIYFPMKNAN